MQTQFTWDPQHEALVKAEWKEKIRIRLKDRIYKVGKQPSDKLVVWVTDELRAGLKDKREHDEDFKKRSERNRKNKVEGPKAKIGHSRGSISSTMWFDKLVM